MLWNLQIVTATKSMHCFQTWLSNPYLAHSQQLCSHEYPGRLFVYNLSWLTYVLTIISLIIFLCCAFKLKIWSFCVMLQYQWPSFVIIVGVGSAFDRINYFDTNSFNDICLVWKRSLVGVSYGITYSTHSLSAGIQQHCSTFHCVIF